MSQNQINLDKIKGKANKVALEFLDNNLKNLDTSMHKELDMKIKELNSKIESLQAMDKKQAVSLSSHKKLIDEQKITHSKNHENHEKKINENLQKIQEQLDGHQKCVDEYKKNQKINIENRGKDLENLKISIEERLKNSDQNDLELKKCLYDLESKMNITLENEILKINAEHNKLKEMFQNKYISLQDKLLDSYKMTIDIYQKLPQNDNSKSQIQNE